MTFTLKELEYLERLKAEYREEYPDTPEEEIRLMAHRALEVRRFKTKQDAADEPSKDDKVFLIYCLDGNCTPIGYIRGSEEDADRYCEAYNANVKSHWEAVDFEELEQLN